MCDTGALHQEAHQIVGDSVHGNLFPNHGGRQAAQHIQAEENLDFPEVEFDSPSFEIERGQLACSDKRSDQARW